MAVCEYVIVFTCKKKKLKAPGVAVLQAAELDTNIIGSLIGLGL